MLVLIAFYSQTKFITMIDRGDTTYTSQLEINSLDMEQTFMGEDFDLKLAFGIAPS